MKEVLTKSFWLGVKKTFYDALEETPPPANEPAAPASAPAPTSPPPAQGEQK